jgi:hypothetical protein
MAEASSLPVQNRTGITGGIQFTGAASTHYATICGRAVVDMAHITESSAYNIGSCLSEGSGRVGAYIKEHWKTLIIYTVVWALIIVSSGILYGFKRTALPLTIGMSAGVGFGLITALLTTKVFDPHNKHSGRNTAVGWFSHHSIKVDPTTKQIALTILVAVYLAACIKFPHATGALSGAVIGNHLFVQLLCHKKKKEENKKRETEIMKCDHKEEVAQLRKELDELKALIKPQLCAVKKQRSQSAH